MYWFWKFDVILMGKNIEKYGDWEWFIMNSIEWKVVYKINYIQKSNQKEYEHSTRNTIGAGYFN